MRFKKAVAAFSAVLLATAIAGIGIAVSGSTAQAAIAPSQGNPTWASNGSIEPSKLWTTDDANFPSTTDARTSGMNCAAISDATFDDPGNTSAVINIFAGSFATPAAYVAGSGTFSTNFLSQPCVAQWGLTGDWFIPENSDAPSIYGTDGDIETTPDWMGTTPPTIAQSDEAATMYLLRTDGTIVEAQLLTETNNPSAAITITPAPVNIEINAGDPLTVQTGDLTEGATYSDGSTGTPDIATIVTLPTGATSDPDALFDFTTETPGSYPFTYSLADEATNPEATSAVVTGTIQVDPTGQIVGVPQTYNLSVGDTLNLTAAELSTGATNSLDGSAVGSDIVVFNPPLPAGATANDLDNGQSLTFSATTPGTFTFSYYLSYLAKTPDTSNVITSTINVTSPAVHLPTVTG
jgi:hypothetical protein